MEDRRYPVRLLVVVFSVAFLFFWIEGAIDVWRAGASLKDFQVTPAMVRSAVSSFSRAYNNILATMLTFIALAIPITANLYTPKLVEFFVRDRINLAVLCSFAILSAHAIFSLTLSFDRYAGTIPFWVASAGAIVGWLVLIPYYFYVLTFLHPAKIIELVERSIVQELRRLARRRAEDRKSQSTLSWRIQHLGTVLLKAVDRGDRDVAVEAVRAHMRLLPAVRALKPGLAPKFLEVDDQVLPGMSTAALGIVNERRIWIEHRILTQLIFAFQGALGKMPDGVSSLADTIKDAAEDEARRGEPYVLDLLIRVLNTFVREAIKKKDIYSIYNVFYNYKSLARRLMSCAPDRLPEIARHLRYYSTYARENGMPFAYELAGYELAELAEHAFEAKLPQAQDLVEALLSLEGLNTSVRLVKSRLLLAGYLQERGREEELKKLRASFTSASSAVVDAAKRELLGKQERVFWEVTDRGTNLDYVEDGRKARIGEFLASLGL